MTRPKLLDLFCGAGGASMGYHRGGFDVYGVDLINRKRYPFAFRKGDAISVLEAKLDGQLLEFTHKDGTTEQLGLDAFAAVHASPPCQAYSHSTEGFRNAGAEYPDLLAPTRDLLLAIRQPWIIENVPGAPMRADYRLCGCYFGLQLRRDRWFETSWHGFAMMPTHDHSGPSFSVIGDYSTSAERKKLGRAATSDERNRAMGIDWMKGHELGLAIPPDYSQWLSTDLLAAISTQALSTGAKA